MVQRTELRARSAPLDTLATSWSAMESRAPSRAGTVSRAGSRASRKELRAAARRSSHGMMPQSGTAHGDSRTDEIQRLQSAIRDIKSACVHFADRSLANAGTRSLLTRTHTTDAGLSRSVTEGFDDEFSAAARAAPWGMRTLSEAGTRCTQAVAEQRSGILGAVAPVPYSSLDSHAALHPSGSSFVSGQAIDVRLVDGFWAASSGEDDSIPTLSSRAGTPLTGRRGDSRGNTHNRPSTPLSVLLTEQRRALDQHTGQPANRSRRDSTTGRPLHLALPPKRGQLSRRGSRQDEAHGGSHDKTGGDHSRGDESHDSSSQRSSREDMSQCSSHDCHSRPSSRGTPRSSCDVSSRPGSRESPSRPGSRENRVRPSSRESLRRTGSRESQRGARDTPRLRRGSAVSRKSKNSLGTAEDFCGLAARNAFFQIFKDEKQLTSTEGIDAPLLDSARHVFVSACDAHQVMPLPLLITDPSRGDAEGCMNLNSYQIGDKAATAYTKGLVRMVQQGVTIEELDLSDNSLTHIAAKAVAEAMPLCPSLKVLNLCSNRIGNEGTTAIAAALRNHCALEELCLERNQLGDRCASVVLEAASVHPSLTKLDLSDNMLGDRPGNMFGKALYEFLRVNEMLEQLDLSYNRIGANRAAAEQLAQGMAENSTVKHLDLSMNAVRDRGGCALGSALRFNTGLVELDLKENSIGEKGAMVIADALKENKVLEQLTLDNNPIGPRGGRAILRAFVALVYLRRDCTIEIKGCNFSLSDPSFDKILSPNNVEQFDRGEPGGTWVCDLSMPYERMVANELVDLAWVEDGENWKDETMDGKDFELPEPPPGEIWTRDDYKLPEQGIMEVTYLSSKRAPKPSDAMDDPTFNALRLLIERFAENPRRPVLQIQLYRDCREEQVIRSHFSRFGEVTHIEFVVYVDGEGWVRPPKDRPDEATSAFVHFANTKGAEKAMRMIDGDGDGVLDKAGAMLGDADLDPQWASELSTAPDKMEALLRLVGSEAFFTARQISGLMLMFTEDHWRTQILSFLMYRCVDMENFNSEVMDFLDESAFNALEDKLGQLFYFTPNNPTGHYKLQLHQPLQRIIMSKLVEISIDQRLARRHDDDGDGKPDVVNTSQKGDWDNWRNERIDYYDGEGMQEYDFDEKRPWDLPKDGLIECDYVSTDVQFRLENVPPIADELVDEFIDDLHAVWKSIHVGAMPQNNRGYRRGSVTVADATRGIMAFDASDEARERLKVAHRPPWQIPNQTKPIYCKDKEERLEYIAQRVLLMVRRCTNECYFSTDQIRKIMKFMPPAACVEAMVTLFSRITDLENHTANEILTDEDDYVKYCNRLGIANIFNPFRADVMYELNLKIPDERAVAALLVEMTDEVGENWVGETYNGMPFEMGISWVEEGPPTLGILSLKFVTNPGTADLFMRANMAKRLLMPGPGRWRAVPEELRVLGQDGDEIDRMVGIVQHEMVGEELSYMDKDD